ncbi:MAG: type II toxin-antitoxin system RelE/ParE family toxin [Planctomycetota bacterium]
MLIIRDDAEADVEEAFNWYQKHRDGLGADFLLVVEAGLAVIERNPRLCQVVYKQTRRLLLRRFPFGLFYIFDDKTIEVLACMHCRRNPTEWRERT